MMNSGFLQDKNKNKDKLNPWMWIFNVLSPYFDTQHGIRTKTLKEYKGGYQGLGKKTQKSLHGKIKISI